MKRSSWNHKSRTLLGGLRAGDVSGPARASLRRHRWGQPVILADPSVPNPASRDGHTGGDRGRGGHDIEPIMERYVENVQFGRQSPADAAQKLFDEAKSQLKS